MTGEVHQFRKIATPVMAILYRGPQDRCAVREFVTAAIDEHTSLHIQAAGGRWLRVAEGDWIVKDTDGNFYPAHPDGSGCPITFEKVPE